MDYYHKVGNRNNLHKVPMWGQAWSKVPVVCSNDQYYHSLQFQNRGNVVGGVKLFVELFVSQ